MGEVYFKFNMSVENDTSAKFCCGSKNEVLIPEFMLQTSRELPGDGMVSHDGARRRSAEIRNRTWRPIRRYKYCVCEHVDHESFTIYLVIFAMV